MGYSDARFEAVTEEIEERLGDLMGIEAVASSLRSLIQQQATDPENADLLNTQTYRMPTQIPYTVYPSLPIVDSEQNAPQLDGIFETGKGAAFGTGSWIRGLLVQHLYGVDAGAIIAAAQSQQASLREVRNELVDEFSDVKILTLRHWTGGASDEFSIWADEVFGVVDALLQYAAAAQVSAGATGDVIRASQRTMLEQAERIRDDLDDALATWREDADVFPFPPGTGYKLTALVNAVTGKVQDYVDKIPGGQIIVDKAISSGKATKYVGAFNTAFDLLEDLEAKDTDPETPDTAAQFMTGIETAFSDIATKAESALDALGEKIALDHAEITSEPALALARLPHPRNPGGTYTP